jgi:ParB family chromosome partitioning protein
MTEKPRRLGRGLEALLSAPGVLTGPPTSAPTAGGTAVATPDAERSGLQQIRVGEIRPNPFQPRKEFRPEELADLEASLKVNGLLQPITVRRAPAGGGFELIAGERRLRAATRLGWSEIPAIVRDVDDRTLGTLALVENLQRVDLNPVEEAEGYQRLVDTFSLTQQQVADVVGKDRSTVANMLRVLHLPVSVRRMLREGQVTLGHARALLALPNEIAMTDLAREIVARGLSVREVERRVREAVPGGGRKREEKKPGKPGARDGRDPEVKRLEDQLRRYLQTDVSLQLNGPEKGEIRIAFYSSDDLQRVLELVLGTTGDAL